MRTDDKIGIQMEQREELEQSEGEKVEKIFEIWLGQGEGEEDEHELCLPSKTLKGESDEFETSRRNSQREAPSVGPYLIVPS